MAYKMILETYTKDEANGLLQKFRGTGLKFVRKNRMYIATHPDGDEYAQDIIKGYEKIKKVLKRQENGERYAADMTTRIHRGFSC